MWLDVAIFNILVIKKQMCCCRSDNYVNRHRFRETSCQPEFSLGSATRQVNLVVRIFLDTCSLRSFH